MNIISNFSFIKGKTFGLSHIVYSIMFLLMGGCLLTGCGMGQDNGENKNNSEIINKFDSKDKNLHEEFIMGMDQFGIKLLNVMLDEEKNQLLSPYSIATALSMTLAGADGKTAQEILDTLYFSKLNDEEIHQSHEALIGTLNDIDPEVNFEVANSIWLKQHNTNFYDSFTKLLHEKYEAGLLDLTTAEAMNRWVSEKTKGKIEDLVEDIDPDAILLLLNTVYFLGNWTIPFDETLTSDKDFYMWDGKRASLPFMTRSGSMLYQETKEYKAVRLPYGQERIYMEILLPKEGQDVSLLLKSLGEEKTDWEVPLEKKQGTLSMPKFSFTYDVTLNEILIQMGMESAFDVQRADFSKMAEVPPAIYINEVKHKSFIEVNEKGTEASAATSVEMVRGASPLEEFQMIVDRPFLFRIRDENTGVILFLGHVSNPVG